MASYVHDPGRRCRAHYQADKLVRCTIMVPEAAEDHAGDHKAPEEDGGFRWVEALAIYPTAAEIKRMLEAQEIGDEIRQKLRANDPTMGAEVIREKLAANGIGNGSARLSQVGGEHYRKFKIQPWDVIDEYGLGFYAGNALKYLLRAGHKGAKVEDLRKARHYIDKMIELEEGADGGS